MITELNLLVYWLVFLAGVILLVLSLMVLIRNRGYFRYLHYDPRCSYNYNFDETKCCRCSVKVTRDGLTAPKLKDGFDTAFLAAEVRATFKGWLFDPYVEFICNGRVSRQYFERGVKGLRYLNISDFLSNWPEQTHQISMRGRHIRWPDQEAVLVLFNNLSVSGVTTIAIAPHPDDAELGAFCLYSHANTVLVTLTAGNAGGYDFPTAVTGGKTSYLTKLRVWDSLTVGSIGGVRPEKALNLCHWDGKLAAMYAEPRRDFSGHGPEGVDFHELRQQNNSPLLRASDATSSWDFLVTELADVFRQVQPKVIVIPYPFQDNHQDHLFSTLAVCNGLKSAGLNEGLFFCYLNHCKLTELYPFGPTGSIVPLPPNFEGVMKFSSIYSHPLSVEVQKWKFFAMEAMHDLREMPKLHPQPWRATLRSFARKIYHRIQGYSSDPTHYFRRAIRYNELFFVIPFSNSELLAAEVLNNIGAVDHPASLLS